MLDELKKQIDALSRVEMARLWRFAPVGHPMFHNEAGVYFNARFAELGGFSPEISKLIGWEG